MRFRLVLIYFLIGIFVSSCSPDGEVSKTDGTVSGIPSPVPSNPVKEVPLATLTPINSDDLQDFYKQNHVNKMGYRIPRDKGRKYVRTAERTLRDGSGKEIKVASSDFSFNYEEPWKYFEDSIDPRGPLNLESVFFTEYSIRDKIFMYFILAEEDRVPPPSNTDSSLLRFGYFIKDRDGDGIFETLVNDRNDTIPEWVLR